MAEREDWLEYLDRCDGMLLNEKYSFADETLTGIRNWISEHQHVTDRQKKAIDNIKESVR